MMTAANFPRLRMAFIFAMVVACSVEGMRDGWLRRAEGDEKRSVEDLVESIMRQQRGLGDEERHDDDETEDNVDSVPTIQPFPSSVPSLSPSASPTDFPTPAPTPLPTPVPSSTPSFSPTPSPSSSPSSSPSVAPSFVPSEIPSDLPSSFPSVEPSSFPSIEPSDMPSSAPTQICAVENDLFGTEEGESTSLGFDYDITFEPGTTAEQRDAILQALESEIVNSLLPSLFGDVCSEVVPTDSSIARFFWWEGRRELLEQQRQLQTDGVNGLSSQPQDVIVNGVSCQGDAADNANCFAVDGGATVFGDVSSVNLESVKDILREKMANGEFDNIDGVVSVRLRDDNISPATIQQEPDDEPEPNSGDGFPLWAWIVIPLSALCLICTIGAILWNRHQSNEDEDGGKELDDAEIAAPDEAEPPAPPAARVIPDLSTIDEPIMA